MKRFVVLLAINCLLLFSAGAQALLGYTAQQIRDKYPTAHPKAPGETTLSVFLSHGKVSFYFNASTGRCYHCTQVPYSDDERRRQIEEYTPAHGYVIVSPTEWTISINGATMYIKLKKSERSNFNYFDYGRQP